jgi:hypothetical protein
LAVSDCQQRIDRELQHNAPRQQLHEDVVGRQIRLASAHHAQQVCTDERHILWEKRLERHVELDVNGADRCHHWWPRAWHRGWL